MIRQSTWGIILCITQLCLGSLTIEAQAPSFNLVQDIGVFGAPINPGVYGYSLLVLEDINGD